MISDLTKEVKDICSSLDWKFATWPLENLVVEPTDQKINGFMINDIRGISFTPPDCETVFLTFLPDGKLFCPIHFAIDNSGFRPSDLYWIHTKTQYAGIDVHLAVMKLFIYLQDKYFAKLELSDEGKYWETRDVEILKIQFENYGALISQVNKAISSITFDPDESAISVANKIEKALQNLHKQLGE